MRNHPPNADRIRIAVEEFLGPRLPEFHRATYGRYQPQRPWLLLKFPLMHSSPFGQSAFTEQAGQRGSGVLDGGGKQVQVARMHCADCPAGQDGCGCLWQGQVFGTAPPPTPQSTEEEEWEATDECLLLAVLRELRLPLGLALEVNLDRDTCV